MQVQRAIEIDFLASWMEAYHRGLTSGCPHRCRRGLQIETGLILSQEYRLRYVLRSIYQFFSSCSSNSVTLDAERDLYTLAGR
jgi:hypothetical protein